MIGTLARHRLSLLLLLLCGYLFFAYPFMQLRVPPSGVGVPFGELALGAILVSINLPLIVSRIGSVIFVPPVLFMWAWGFTRLILDAVKEGPWAFRDGTQLIETLFLVVSFAVIAGPSQIARFSRWLRYTLIASCLYGLFYIFAIPIMAMSPTLPGGSGQAIPIFGTFATTGTMLLWGAFYCMIQPARRPLARLRYAAIAGFLVSYAVLLIQARTIYVQLLSLSVLLFFVRPAALRAFGLSIPILFGVLLFISVFEFRISGRLGSEISFAFLWNHVQAIFGVAEKSAGGIAEAASGVSLRFGWWLRLYRELTSDSATLLTGLGYGVALTDFRDTLGTLAREPHNSMISIIARGGLVGGVCWFWMQIELFRTGFRTYRECKRLGRGDEGRLVVLIMGFAVLTLASCFGEDTMEKPYNAIPYYVLWGVVLRVAYCLREGVYQTATSRRAVQLAGNAS